jgi:hypothetical protein
MSNSSTPPTKALEFARERLTALLSMHASPAWKQIIEPMLQSARKELAEKVLTGDNLTPVQREEARQHYLAYTAFLAQIDNELTAHCTLLARHGHEIPSEHQHRVAPDPKPNAPGAFPDPFAIMGSDMSTMLKDVISKLPLPPNSPPH